VTPDPIDQLGARLFEAARNEAPPAGAEQRALQAAKRVIEQEGPGNVVFSARRKWIAAATFIALAAGSALLVRPREVNPGISAEPTTYNQREPERGIVPPQQAASAAVPALPSAPVSAKPSPNLAPTVAHSAAVSLSDELSALKVASSALSSGDTQAALAALDRYDRVLKGQKMRAEATLLRLEALSRSGQTEAASRLAQRFVEQNPGSPLVDRARSFVRE